MIWRKKKRTTEEPQAELRIRAYRGEIGGSVRVEFKGESVLLKCMVARLAEELAEDLGVTFEKYLAEVAVIHLLEEELKAGADDE